MNQNESKEKTALSQLLNFIEEYQEQNDNMDVRNLKGAVIGLLSTEQKQIVEAFDTAYDDGYLDNGKTGKDYYTNKFWK